MHETIFHERSSIRRLASPTCMLIYLLNLSFIFACIVNHFYFHLVSSCIHFHICFQFPISESGKPWPRLYLHWDIITQSREGRLCIPLQKSVFLPRNYPQGLLWEFLKDSDCCSRKLCNAICKLAVTPSWNCALHNPNIQQLVCIGIVQIQKKV